jgi:mRNA-degrading endonuclease RelE of RelBE toxin-antitoxin system
MYQVKVADEAGKFIRKQDKRIQRQIINNIRALAPNPRPQNCKKLRDCSSKTEFF